MEHRQAMKYFAQYEDGRLSAVMRKAVDDHLGACNQCSHDYAATRSLLDQKNLTFLPHLAADPYLPTRVRSLAEEADLSYGKKGTIFRWTLAALAGTAAIWIGITLGSGLNSRTTLTADSDDYSVYDDAMSQQNFADDWSAVSLSQQEDKK
jgi:anti-sigma factor RsiW